MLTKTILPNSFPAAKCILSMPLKENGAQSVRTRHNRSVSASSANRHNESPSGNEFDRDILDIALPTLATLAADPLAALISTAFVGRLGAVSLAAVGISLSLFNTLTKMFNMPLLAVTTSTVATALGSSEKERRPLSKIVGLAVSAALLLAGATGVLEAGLLTTIGIPGLSLFGAGPLSPMNDEAVSYLGLRALGAPVTAVFLTLQGVFRGLGRTKVPLCATLACNGLIIFLDWLLLIHFKFGVSGAAWGVSIAQCLSSVVLIKILVDEDLIKPLDGSAIRTAFNSLGATGLLILRTLALSGTFASGTALAARAGPAVAAGHQVAFQTWLASSLLADSLAVAAQSLVAMELASGNVSRASGIANRSLVLSIQLGMVLAIGLFASAPLLPGLFSSDATVVSVIQSLLPVIIVTQPINAVAFLLDGILYGVNGFPYAAKALVLCAIPSASLMWIGSHYMNPLLAIWLGLTLVMTLRVTTIYVPYYLKLKPFDILL